jgi:hypothetical protein
MHRSRSLGIVILFLVGLFAADRAAASVVTSMDTETLVRRSAVIVRGTVESQASALDPYGNVQTLVTVRVEESLKGASGHAHITLTVPGGVWGDRVSLVHGAARFTSGEPVVVFASFTKGGVLTVTGLFQGKFRIETSGGAAMAVPEAGDSVQVLGGAQRSRQPLEAFLSTVRELVGRHPGASSVDGVIEQAPPGGGITPAFTFINPILPMRWFEPDMGLPIAYKFNVASAPLAAADARAGFAASLENWSHIRGANVALTNGGDTFQVCRIFNDGSVVSHGDPCDQMEAFDPLSCSGVLAVTGVSGFQLQTKVVNGVSFLRMTETDTVFNSDTECFFAGSEQNYEETLSHELGHGIGLGHSCGDVFSPECVPGTEADDALMRAFVHGDRGGMPRADDVDGARLIYPALGFVDLQQNRDTFTTGQTLTLRADFNGTTGADFYVLGIRPDRSFFSLAPGLPSNQIVPLATNLALAFTMDVTLFSHAFTGAEQAGTYSWIAVLTRPGTDVRNMANWLSFDTAGFTFTP